MNFDQFITLAQNQLHGKMACFPPDDDGFPPDWKPGTMPFVVPFQLEREPSAEEAEGLINHLAAFASGGCKRMNAQVRLVASPENRFALEFYANPTV